ncbi:cupin domain-containing protein [Spirosoma foliorum]|uniref:Cupin domain-containing protein n=1 Tax=Spirosoma foliorum TaxID=2710596 RepID=A0A7G5H1L3_9BACT|nr:cupin domain-containing protein [Spirosoma foliorum]QMW05005.1 cupin domain-containing protein [Spirosoma foliorum]
MTTPPRAGLLTGRTITNPVLKEDTIFLEISRESDGRHTLVDVLLAPGAGTPMHYHTDFSEEFTCLEGELSLKIDKQIIRLKRGKSVSAPARCKHRFFNQSGEPCRFQCRFTPGFPGFEQTLQISYGLARDGKTTAQGIPKNPYALGYLVLISETRMTGYLGLFQPLFNWLGRQALKNGVAADLQRRYLAVW